MFTENVSSLLIMSQSVIPDKSVCFRFRGSNIRKKPGYFSDKIISHNVWKVTLCTLNTDNTVAICLTCLKTSQCHIFILRK